jgi:hypothetical protein
MFTQKLFEALADMIRANHALFTYPVTVGIADEMARRNARFKRHLFMRAAGWENEPDAAESDAVGRVAA